MTDDRKSFVGILWLFHVFAVIHRVSEENVIYKNKKLFVWYCCSLCKVNFYECHSYGILKVT